MKIEEYISNHPECQIEKKKGLLKKYYEYKPSGAKMVLYRRYIKSDGKQICCEGISQKNMDFLQNINQEVSTNTLLSILEAKDKSCAIVEIAEYIPHDFVPIVEPVFITGNEVEKIDLFLKKK